MKSTCCPASVFPPLRLVPIPAHDLFDFVRGGINRLVEKHAFATLAIQMTGRFKAGFHDEPVVPAQNAGYSMSRALAEQTVIVSPATHVAMRFSDTLPILTRANGRAHVPLQRNRTSREEPGTNSGEKVEFLATDAPQQSPRPMAAAS